MRRLKPHSLITTRETLSILQSVRRRFPSRVSFLTPVDKRILTRLDQVIANVGEQVVMERWNALPRAEQKRQLRKFAKKFVAKVENGTENETVLAKMEEGDK